MPRIRHYHWVVAFCCFLLMLCNVGFLSTSFNVYQPYIVALPGVGDSAGSIIIGVRTFMSLLCMFAVVRYYQFFDCRRGSFIACLITTICLVVFGCAKSFPLLCVAAAIGGIAYGLGGMVCTTMLINRWFKTDVGTAVGIAAVGSGVASIIVPVCAEWIISTFDLSLSFWVEAVFALVIAFTTYTLLRDKPDDLGFEPYVSEKWLARHADDVEHVEGHEDMPVDHGVKLPQATRGLFVFATLLVGGASVTAPTFLSVLLVSEGTPHATAALVLSVLGVVLTFGKFAMGKLFDALGGFAGTIIAFSTFAIGLVLICQGAVGDFMLVWVGTVIFAFGLSIGSTGIPMWSMQFSTPEERVGTIRTFQLGYAAGGFAFTMVPGILKDVVGTYLVSYYAMAVMLFVALAIILAVYLRYAR